MTFATHLVLCAIGLGIYLIGRWQKNYDLMVISRAMIITTVLISIFPLNSH